MRLTLRTLLAYMDGLLDPKDTQEIGKKLEDSKFATDLFHKIRDVMRRLRLGAPSVNERSANVDCNTVAEYLDNAMPGERVPDFEEVSLKSEMHLAEVASCHQILTMVLGEPVEIEPESRQRMYQLPTVANRVDEERLAAAGAAMILSGDGNGPVPAAAPVTAKPRPIVPEYLGDPPKKSRLLPAAAIMLFVGAAIGLLVLTFYPSGLQWLEAKIHGKAADEEDRDDGDGKRAAKSTEDSAAVANSLSANSDAAKSSDAAAKSSQTGPIAGTNESAAPAITKDSGAAAVGDNKIDAPTAPADKSPVALPGTNPAATAGPSLTPGTLGLPGGAVAPATAATVTPGIAPPGTLPPAMETKPLGGEKSPVKSVANPGIVPSELKPLPTQVAKLDPSAALNPGITSPAAGPGSTPPSAEEKSKIGRFMSDGQDVLLKFEANTSSWRRVLPEEFLLGHQPLLAFPSYRPRVVVLNVGATLELINGTRIELLPDNAQGQPGFDIDFGRVVIKPLAQAGARLGVVVGAHSGTITLTNVESIAGLEVTRVHDAGTDPEKVFSHALTKLYLARGGAVWEEGGGKPPARLTAPAELMLDGTATDSPPGAAIEVPKWITANTINELDQRAALAVSQALPENRAARLSLMELTEDRKREIRWLAARCLGYLGQFDPMTAALNDIDVHSEWHDYIDQLKEAIARGPETAAGIRQSLEKQYGNDSGELYRMLWGYTDKQLADGEDARLVKFLDHESPVFRVLAFENLRDITHKGLFYHPESNAAKRLTSVQQWRRLQQSGQIRFSLPEVTPGSHPSKEAVPTPPRPLEDGAPADIKPVSAVEPIVPDNGPSGGHGVSNVSRPVRLPVSVPEPDPPESRPHIVYPEPRPASGP